MSGEESVGTESVSLGSWSSLIMRFSLVSNSTRFLKKNNPVIMSLVSNHDILNGYFDTAISQYLIFNSNSTTFQREITVVFNSCLTATVTSHSADKDLNVEKPMIVRRICCLFIDVSTFLACRRTKRSLPITCAHFTDDTLVLRPSSSGLIFPEDVKVRWLLPKEDTENKTGLPK